MTLSLPQEKVEKTKTQCKELLEKSLLSVRELSTLIGRLLPTTVVIPVTLQYGAFQHQQIQGINFLERHLSLSIQASEELHWCTQNPSLYNGKFLYSPPAQLIISSDASTQDWDHHVKGKQQVVHGLRGKVNPT